MENQPMTAMPAGTPAGYQKKSVWKWVFIYLIIAVVLYGVIYYFAGGKSDTTAPTADEAAPAADTTPTPTPAAY